MTGRHETDMAFGDTCRTAWFWAESQDCHFQVQSLTRNILTLVCSLCVLSINESLPVQGYKVKLKILFYFGNPEELSNPISYSKV